MLSEHADYRSYLKGVLAERISRNPSYSLRAFARHLGIHHSMLVSVFQSKKRLSVDRAHQLANHLELQGKDYEHFCLLVEIDNAKTAEQKAFLQSRLQDLSPHSPIRDLSIEHFKVISEWYHLPMLQMVGMPNFSAETVAKRLSISKIEAELAIERLERLDLVARDSSGRYQKTEARMLAQSSVAQEGLRKYHKQMFLRAIDSLTEQSPQEKWDWY